MDNLADYVETELPQILDLIRHSDVREIALREGDIEIRLSRSSTTLSFNETEEFVVEDTIPPAPPTRLSITSPLVGTFYRAAQPGMPPMAAEGMRVENDTVVGIVEALQVLTDVEAGCSGLIVNVLATDGQPVEYGQPLFEVAIGG